MALLSHFAPGKPYLLVLPGSHMKFVSVDREDRITGCLTSISGELLAAITTGTILADAVRASSPTRSSSMSRPCWQGGAPPPAPVLDVPASRGVF